MAQRFSNKLSFSGSQKGRGGGIDEGDHPFLVHADDAGGDARQHGFYEAAPTFRLRVGLKQCAALAFKLLGHPVERHSERSDFIVALRRVDACIKITAANAFSR